jgi:hypothetical protein
MAVRWEVLDSIPAVEPTVADWDRLAVDAGRPFDGDWLVGVGPFCRNKPAMVSLVEAVRLSVVMGKRRFDLGPGPQAYKYRFTDERDLLLWQTLIPPGRRYVASRAAFAPNEARHAIGSRLTREQKRRVRRLLRRAGIRLRGDEGEADSPSP